MLPVHGRRCLSKLPLNAAHVKKLLAPTRCLHLGEHFTRGTLKEIELTTPVPLAGRKYLPSSDTPGFPKFLSGPKENYPALVKVRNARDASLTLWAKRSREVIDEAYEQYEKDGTAVAILFRGFHIRNGQDFAEWSGNLGYQSFAYVGGTAPRSEIANNVAEGALDDKQFSIEPHNEMSYSVRFPKIFTMASFQTAAWGGETASCDNREILVNLDPSFVGKCERKKIRYWHCLPDQESETKGTIFKSWQMQFLTEDRSKVEAYLEDLGYGYQWELDGGLLYWHNLTPFTTHPKSGERLWFNQITAQHCSYHCSTPLFEGVKLPSTRYPFHTTYGDGEEIDQAMIDEHRRITWKNAFSFQWRDGDVLFIDNLILQHSRLSFEGERKVGISLLAY